MSRKVYRLFGIPVWTVETEDTAEDTELHDDPHANLGAQISTPTEPPPVFGFTTNFDWFEDKGRNN